MDRAAGGGAGVLTSSPPSAPKGCRLGGKDSDSSCETALLGSENVPGIVAVAVAYRAASRASPLPYSKTFQAFRASAPFTAAAGLG